jgi:hypothetical protein
VTCEVKTMQWKRYCLTLKSKVVKVIVALTWWAETLVLEVSSTVSTEFWEKMFMTQECPHHEWDNKKYSQTNNKEEAIPFTWYCNIVINKKALIY